MHYLLYLSALAVLLVQCPQSSTLGQRDAPGAGAKAHAASLPALELACADGELRILQDGVAKYTEPAAGAVPYQIVALGPPAIITTCGEDLRLVTWAVGAEAHPYPGLLPAQIAPPLSALSSLEDPETDPLAGCTLLSPEGAVLWQRSDCDLLVPTTPAASATTAYALRGFDGDAISPYGQSPALIAIDAVTGTELWQTKLVTQFAVAGAELWGTGSRLGLLSLQTGYEDYEFVLFELATGKEAARIPFQGQIAYRLVYPGPDAEPAAFHIDGDTARLLVQDLTVGLQTLVFDLGSGACSREKSSVPAEGYRREDNPAAVGGAGTPDPAAPPFPQQLLPVAAGSAWRIPAYRDAEGRVLVLSASAARWITLPAG